MERERERENDFMEADFIALLDIGTMSLERDISIVSNVKHLEISRFCSSFSCN